MTKIVNLYGGPGTGKSTSAAFIFYALKQMGINAELVREYVKDWAWDKRAIGPYDQLYFLGKQVRRESMLYGKVDFIVTDAPIMLNTFYANSYAPKLLRTGINESVRGFYAQAKEDGHVHRHVFLNRTKAYNPAGRYQSEEGAREIDSQIYGLLEDELGKVEECQTDEFSLRQLIATLVSK